MWWITQKEVLRRTNMTSPSCGVDALLRAAQFLDEQETAQVDRPTVLESPKLSTGKRKDFLVKTDARLPKNTFRGPKTDENRYIICNVRVNKWKKLNYAAMFRCVLGKSCHHLTVSLSLFSLLSSLLSPFSATTGSLHNLSRQIKASSAVVCCMEMLLIACWFATQPNCCFNTLFAPNILTKVA